MRSLILASVGNPLSYRKVKYIYNRTDNSHGNSIVSRLSVAVPIARYLLSDDVNEVNVVIFVPISLANLIISRRNDVINKISEIKNGTGRYIKHFKDLEKRFQLPDTRSREIYTWDNILEFLRPVYAIVYLSILELFSLNSYLPEISSVKVNDDFIPGSSVFTIEIETTNNKLLRLVLIPIPSLGTYELHHKRVNFSYYASVKKLKESLDLLKRYILHYSLKILETLRETDYIALDVSVALNFIVLVLYEIGDYVSRITPIYNYYYGYFNSESDKVIYEVYNSDPVIGNVSSTIYVTITKKELDAKTSAEILSGVWFFDLRANARNFDVEAALDGECIKRLHLLEKALAYSFHFNLPLLAFYASKLYNDVRSKDYPIELPSLFIDNSVLKVNGKDPFNYSYYLYLQVTRALARYTFKAVDKVVQLSSRSIEDGITYAVCPKRQVSSSGSGCEEGEFIKIAEKLSSSGYLFVRNDWDKGISDVSYDTFRNNRHQDLKKLMRSLLTPSKGDAEKLSKRFLKCCDAWFDNGKYFNIKNISSRDARNFIAHSGKIYDWLQIKYVIDNTAASIWIRYKNVCNSRSYDEFIEEFIKYIVEKLDTLFL